MLPEKEKTLLVIVPTRGRPEKIREFLPEAFNNSQVGWWGAQRSEALDNIEGKLLSEEYTLRTDFAICLDDDDPTLQEYLSQLDGYIDYCLQDSNKNLIPALQEERSKGISQIAWSGTLHVDVGPRIKMCPSVNRALQTHNGYDYYFFMGDDHRIRTRGWTYRVLEHMLRHNDKAVVYGDDLMMHERLASAFAVSKKLIDKQVAARKKHTGEDDLYIAAPGLIHMYMDNQMMDLGRAFGGLVYDPQIVVEHLHYTQGKSAEDEGYKSVNNDEVFKHDEQVYREWKENILPLVKN